MLGNQPRMKGRAGPGRVDFTCAGGAGMKSENDRHMHNATIIWKDDDHIRAEWAEFQDGRNTRTVSFNLARR